MAGIIKADSPKRDTSLHILWIIVLLLVSACERTAKPGIFESTLSAPGCVSPQWELTFQRSGGLAGVNEVLTLSSTGQASITSEQNSAITIPAEKIHEIESLLGAFCSQTNIQNSNPCSDCFTYSAMLGTGGKTYQAELNDIQFQDSEFRSLFEKLIDLLEQIRNTQPN